MANIIRVTADRPGLNRAGIDHPEGTKDYAPEDLTEQQLDHLRLEPWLKVEIIDPDAPPPAPKGGSKKAV